MSPSSELSSFRPRRRLFGYGRRATDDFLDYLAGVLEDTSRQLEKSESQLLGYRENEQSLNEALLAVAKNADAIKHDVHREVESIRANARELDKLVAATCAHLSAFLTETLETLEQVAGDIQPRGETADSEAELELLEPDEFEEEPSFAAEEPAVEQKDNGPSEETGSLLERLRPYLVDPSDRAPSSGT